jgi:hypothetical protein
MTIGQKAARQAVARIRFFVDERAYCPREGFQLDIALLGLLSKSIRFAEAACQLVAGGFHEEALALSRSVLEVFLTTRYITNKRSEQRAHSYLRFCAAHVVNVEEVFARFLTGARRRSRTEVTGRLLRVGRRIKRRKIWVSIAKMAREPHRDRRDLERDGRPLDVEFHYEGIYEYLSHYAHGTSVSLQTHALGRGQIFRVHSGEWSAKGLGSLALHYALGYLWMSLILVQRHFSDSLPRRIDRSIGRALAALRSELPDGFSLREARLAKSS